MSWDLGIEIEWFNQLVYIILNYLRGSHKNIIKNN